MSPLHPLPVPDGRRDSVAIDFMGPLPEDHGYNMLVTMTDHLGADICLVPVEGRLYYAVVMYYIQLTC